jgi:group I intron endonuclease
VIGGIYKITNKLNKKCYIGQSKDIKTRWKHHCWDAAKGSKLPIHNAIRKYGQDNFIFEIIEECSKEVRDEKEVYYIDLFNSYKDGYNATIGGDCFVKGKNHLAYGKPKAKEHKDKIAKAHKGKPKPKNADINAGSYNVWGYVDSEGNKVICDDISKTRWCKEHNVGRWLIKENIRAGKPVTKGRFEGYQFFNGTSINKSKGK